MSEVRQGPGWWLASDGKWYPPESRPAPPPPPQDAGAAARSQALIVGSAVGTGLGVMGDAIVAGVEKAGSAGFDSWFGVCSFVGLAAAVAPAIPYVRAWIGVTARRRRLAT